MLAKTYISLSIMARSALGCTLCPDRMRRSHNAYFEDYEKSFFQVAGLDVTVQLHFAHSEVLCEPCAIP